ncbi:MAG: Stp1/IreP family PP2C-type Ser/Thr phosphatase [Parachlamydiaceae bacterium]
MLYQISVHCISDIGHVRHNNEDASKLLKEERFFVLADGMGGHQAGEVASTTAVDSLCDLFRRYPFFSLIDIDEAKQLMRKIIQEVNTLVYKLGRENPNLRGMGTTLCFLFLHPSGLIYGHVGDSRIYRFRQGRLEQLSRDHSLLRELIDLGQLSEQQAEDFIYKNIITKAIGTESTVEPTICDTSLQEGDILIMCSDGLSDLVSSDVMESIIASHPEEDVIRLLVEKAKKNGGYDNITVVLVKIERISD